jgi:NitT/TauT family transport system ATP-binding protein
MLTRRPGRLKTIINVDLPRPRKLDVLVSPEFMLLKRNCMALLREETVGRIEAQECNNDSNQDSNQAANNTG